MDMEKLKRRTLYREKNMEEISNRSEEEEEEETVQEEDDGWNNDVLAQIQVGNKKYDKRLKVLRRSFSEMTIAFVVHLIFLIYCTGVHIYDATVFKRCPEPEKFFVGYNTFGGRFKHLTHIFMWGFLVYFFLAFFTDIMPQSGAKVWFRKLVDWLYTTTVWPAAWVVVLLFWLLVLMDKKLLGRTEDFNDNIPSLLDHAWHTFPVFIVIIESLLVYHSYPRNLMAASLTIFGVTNGYIIWLLVIYTKIRVWAYPFINYLNPFTFILFAFICFLLNGLFYILGKFIAQLRWRERFQILQELENEAEENEYQ